MRRASTPTILLILLLVTGAAAGAEESPSRAAELTRELLDVTGAAELGEQMMGQMVQGLRAADDSAPPEFWDHFMEQVDPDELTELIVPIYVEHFTVEELEAAIEFYSSPVGRSILEKMPLVMQQSMMAGQRWGQELAARAAEEMRAFDDEGSDS